MPFAVKFVYWKEGEVDFEDCLGDGFDGVRDLKARHVAAEVGEDAYHVVGGVVVAE